jgi:uncharacterized membrane-anchored protein
MNLPVKIALLVMLCVAQLGAAAWSIVRYESILRSGALYRIRTMPVDPADAFRGRFVAVQPSILLAAPVAPETEALLQRLPSAGKAFAVLATDADGFARAERVVAEPPATVDYLEIESARPQFNRDAQSGGVIAPSGYNIGFSFDRYYMNEGAAPAAERRYAEASRRDASTRAWLAVRVKNGTGVIEGLFIDGVPIEQVVATPSK